MLIIQNIVSVTATCAVVRSCISLVMAIRVERGGRLDWLRGPLLAYSVEKLWSREFASDLRQAVLATVRF